MFSLHNRQLSKKLFLTVSIATLLLSAGCKSTYKDSLFARHKMVFLQQVDSQSVIGQKPDISQHNVQFMLKNVRNLDKWKTK